MKSVYKATGFTKNGYQACFYYNDKCEATDSKDWASFSGGSGWDSAASCVDSDDREFKAFRITSGKCSSEVTIWWLVNFSTVSSPSTPPPCVLFFFYTQPIVGETNKRRHIGLRSLFDTQ